MKSVFTVLILLAGLNAHAGYKAEKLIHWLPNGITLGVDLKGKPCKVELSTSSMLNNHTSVTIYPQGVELHKVPRFNRAISNTLVQLEESSKGIKIVLKSKPGNSYTSSMKQTISVVKSARGTEVTIEEKEDRLLGKTLKASCIID